ncbi:hypothetical protein V1511DRAFT_494792 [Dipodascopsis uninucleata]
MATSAVALEQRDYVTVTTLETITSCSTEVTQCHHHTTSSAAVTSSTPIYYSNTTVPSYNATNTTTPPVATFTGGAYSLQGSVAGVAAAGIVGAIVLAL